MALHLHNFVILCVVLSSVAKQFEVCELVHELRRQGFAEHQLEDLMCIVAESSALQTHVIRGPEPDYTFEYGLFQINDKRWCKPGPFPGNACQVRCSDLLSDNITLASNCVKLILELEGFKAWATWRMFCQGNRLPDHNC